jgi:hypothetical protein
LAAKEFYLNGSNSGRIEVQANEVVIHPLK